MIGNDKSDTSGHISEKCYLIVIVFLELAHLGPLLVNTPFARTYGSH